MDALPRFALLGTCAAAGVGLAVCIAVSLGDRPSLQAQPAHRESDRRRTAVDGLAIGSPAELVPSPVDIQPRVAQNASGESHGASQRSRRSSKASVADRYQIEVRLSPTPEDELVPSAERSTPANDEPPRQDGLNKYRSGSDRPMFAPVRPARDRYMQDRSIKTVDSEPPLISPVTINHARCTTNFRK